MCPAVGSTFGQVRVSEYILDYIFLLKQESAEGLDVGREGKTGIKA